ncbi:hypothetical protein ISF_01944 [Cordyceps fumosorosea ARSEF 2679]|uniref:Stress activated map kinase interacting n=1 Tax=Cordyceps fumosorosea (strain ARSEF 2679) TaxID=1081104 RepID=A0A168CHT9_CORFA|nr:hypothetical protein ISF_01944 [Cordyceps fumosorosea ARSEF 2679]OAA71393.1 hypothetical protein ISF_01944 [Cordyceps fumosorosea ARSEF 2679]
MGLVDYSESESSGSEAEAPAKPIAKPKPGGLDKSKSGKIIVNLAGNAAAAPSTSSSDEPPAKRARTAGGGRFAGFNSFLPAPKNAAPAGGSKGPGLRTSAAPGFSRDASSSSTVDAVAAGGDTADERSVPKSSGLNLPPPKSAVVAEPSIPEGQKPASEVKLTGKPLMFRPLSVAQGKKKKTTAAAAAAKPIPTEAKSVPTPPTPAVEPPKKKPSLFSIPSEDTTPAPGPSLPGSSSVYEPLFETETVTTTHDDHYGSARLAAEPVAESVGDMADDMNLSAAARRELFGRGGGDSQAAAAANRVVNFNMDREYQHNQALRASGQLQPTHNPVRAIQGGGKHSLRQLVTNVQGQKDALEDSFAKGRSNRREASSRYGW